MTEEMLGSDDANHPLVSPIQGTGGDLAEVFVSADIATLDVVAEAPRGGGAASSVPLFAANMLEAILPFVRNVALAHLISPKEFGVAISLSIVIGMLEIITDFGLPIYAVRKTLPVDDAATMGTLQTMAATRAAVLGLALFLVAPYAASAFQAPQATWAYSLLGVICFVRGFENLGVKAAMRNYIFWREGLVIAGSQVAGLVVTLATAAITRDFACTMWGLMATTVVTIALTHVLSPTPFRFAWNREAARDAAAFGRPLVVNGAAVVGSLSDRVVIGTVMSSSVLAVYNVAFGTAMLPRTVLVKFLTSAMLPRFTEVRESGQDQRALIDTWTVALSMLAFTYGLMLDIFGEQVLRHVFGAVYAPSRLVMSLFAMSLSVKFMMLLPNPPAYAAGRTKIITLGSILAAVAILPGLVVLVLTRNLSGFIFSMGLAECAMLAIFLHVSIPRLDFAAPVAWTASAVPYALLAPLAGLCVVYPDLSMSQWALACLCAAFVAAIVYGAMVWRFNVDPIVLAKGRRDEPLAARRVTNRGDRSVLDYKRA